MFIFNLHYQLVLRIFGNMLHKNASQSKIPIVPAEGWFGQPKYSTPPIKHSTLCRFLPSYSSKITLEKLAVAVNTGVRVLNWKGALATASLRSRRDTWGGERRSREWNLTLHQFSHGFATHVHGFATKTKALAQEIPPATPISSPEPSIPLSSGTGKRRRWKFVSSVVGDS